MDLRLRGDDGIFKQIFEQIILIQDMKKAYKIKGFSIFLLKRSPDLVNLLRLAQVFLCSVKTSHVKWLIRSAKALEKDFRD